MRSPLGSLLVPAVLAFHAGCGDDLEPLDQVDPACEAAEAACLVNQHACVLDGEAARCVPCELGQYATGTGQCAPISGTPIYISSIRPIARSAAARR